MSELDSSYLSFESTTHHPDGEYFAADGQLEQHVFIELSQRLGYHEDQIIQEFREEFITTDYSQSEIPLQQAITAFEQQCNIVARQYENTPDRLTVRRGLRISEAAVYYHAGDYTGCVEQLRIVAHDVSLSSDTEKEQLPVIALLLQHIQNRRFGQKTISIAS